MKEKKYINSINYFRAIAIIIIVAGHCIELVGYSKNSIIDQLFYCLIPGGTTFFVFISGFLFHHIFYTNFNFKKFILKKVKFVLTPYLFFTTFLNSFLLINAYLVFDINSNTIKELLINYLTGGVVSAYWYIPFIIMIFLISPLFILFIKTSNKQKIIIASLFLIISLLIHRNMNSIGSVFQNVIYYTPIYLMGIYFSIKKNHLYIKLKGKEFFFLIVAISIALLQIQLNLIGNSFKEFYVFDGIDLMIVQKIFLTVFLFIFLNRFENKKIKFLNIVAENSFGIFFIHCLFIQILIKIKNYYAIIGEYYLNYILALIIVFFLSLLFSLTTKKIFRKKSRYLIGN